MTISSTIKNLNMDNHHTTKPQLQQIDDSDKQESSNNIGSSLNDHTEILHLKKQQQQQQKQQSQQQQTNDDKLVLKNAWGIYFYKADKQKDWKQNVIYITSISHVEDFWSFYTHSYGLRDLSNGSDYMFFKSGCLPMWEDVSSRGGGKWVITIDPKRRKRNLDSYWLHLMLLLIGDMFGCHLSKNINGAVVSLRVKGDRLALWLKKIEDINVIKAIGTKLKDLLNIPSDIQVIYEYHEAKFDDRNNEIRLIV